MASCPQGPKIIFGSRRKGAWRVRRSGPMTQRSRRFACRARHERSRTEQAHPPLTETRSAALPACSDGFDDIDGGPECGVYIQMRGVEQVRIRRGFERGDGPRGVAFVSPLDVGKRVRGNDLELGSELR